MSIARWIGKERLLRRIRALPAAVREQVRKQLEQSAIDLVGAQKRVAPVRTGTLRDSIKWRWGAARGKGGNLRDEFAVTIYIDKPARHYAHLVEFGVSAHENKGRFKGTQNPGHPPQPYFFPTYRAKKRSIKARVKRGVKKAIQSTRGA